VQLSVSAWYTNLESIGVYSFGYIVILKLWSFALKLPIYVVISAANAQNKG